MKPHIGYPIKTRTELVVSLMYDIENKAGSLCKNVEHKGDKTVYCLENGKKYTIISDIWIEIPSFWSRVNNIIRKILFSSKPRYL